MADLTVSATIDTFMGAVDAAAARVAISAETAGAAAAAQAASQPLDADLTAIAGLTSAADKGIQFTGPNTAATYDLTAAGKAILDDATADDQLTTLGGATPTGTGGIVRAGSPAIVSPTLSDIVKAGSGSLAGSVLDITQTWNTTGAPTAIKLNVTNTASAAESFLLDLQVGGASNLRVRKDGSIIWRTSGTTRHGIIMLPFSSDSWGGTYNSTTGANVFAVSSRSNTGVTFELETAVPLSWGLLSSTNIPDLALWRDGAAGELAQRLGTNPQSFRSYNTWTDASNYERAVFGWKETAGVLTIGAMAAGSGTVRPVTLTGAGVTVVPSAVAVVPLTIKGFAAQLANLQEWNVNGGAAVASLTAAGALALASNFGCNGAAPAAPVTGYGTPTNAAVQGGFDAATITLGDLAAAVAKLILDLKATGLVAA